MRARERCPFCETKLIRDESFEYYDDIEERSVVISSEPTESDLFVHGSLALCPKCWYWHWFSGGTMGCIVDWDAAVAKMRSFDPHAPEGCFQELAIFLRRDPNRWNTLDPTAMEKLVAEIWRQNYAHTEVLHVGKPNDGGVDVLFVDSASSQWLIQVKRREEPRHGEGVSTLRNLLGAMQLHPSKLGVIASTADHFTHHAVEATKRAASLGLTVELIDRGRLDRMLQGFHPSFPWMDFLESNHPSHAEFYSSCGFGRL